MSVPAVSVVIPTYNAPGLLLETLATVFAQTFTDFEVVVVNDGCTDDTAERLRPLAEAGRIRLINQANGGIGVARNRGIDEARGRYVALLDHDDLWRPGKLAAQVEYASRHPECSIVSVPWAESTAPQVAIPREGVGADGIIDRPLWRMAHGQMLFCSSSMMFEKAKAAGVRYGERRQCIEDQQFHFGLLARGPVGVAGTDIQMIYRWHAENQSRQADYWYNGVRHLRALDRAGAFADLRAQVPGHLDAFLAHFGRTAAARQLSAGRRARGMRLYAEEFPHQVRDRRLKFLLAMPVLAVSPPAMIRRTFEARQ